MRYGMLKSHVKSWINTNVKDNNTSTLLLGEVDTCFSNFNSLFNNRVQLIKTSVFNNGLAPNIVNPEVLVNYFGKCSYFYNDKKNVSVLCNSLHIKEAFVNIDVREEEQIKCAVNLNLGAKLL